MNKIYNNVILVDKQFRRQIQWMAKMWAEASETDDMISYGERVRLFIVCTFLYSFIVYWHFIIRHILSANMSCDGYYFSRFINWLYGQTVALFSRQNASYLFRYGFTASKIVHRFFFSYSDVMSFLSAWEESILCVFGGKMEKCHSFHFKYRWKTTHLKKSLLGIQKENLLGCFCDFIYQSL